MYKANSLFRPEQALDAIHDGRHALGDHPKARESIPYCISLPEEGIALFTYTWVDRDSNAGAALAIYGPGVGDSPIQQRLADRPIPKDMDFDAWHIEGFSMVQDLKFQKADIAWKNDEVELEFTFDAFHPPYAYSMHEDGCPAFIASNRIEQSGTAKGQLKIGDRIIQLDTTAHRDHSWGARDWMVMQHYKWFQGQVGDNVSVHFWHLHSLGKTDIRGYVYKDGLQASITGMTVDVDTDDQLRQKSMVATLTDEAGRETTLSGEFFAHYPLIPDPDFVLNESCLAVIIDGEAGVGQLEMGWPKAYLDYVSKNGPY